jgi:hypothetical protein
MPYMYKKIRQSISPPSTDNVTSLYEVLKLMRLRVTSEGRNERRISPDMLSLPGPEFARRTGSG